MRSGIGSPEEISTCVSIYLSSFFKANTISNEYIYFQIARAIRFSKLLQDKISKDIER